MILNTTTLYKWTYAALWGTRWHEKGKEYEQTGYFSGRYDDLTGFPVMKTADGCYMLADPASISEE